MASEAKKDDEILSSLVMQCALAILEGHKTVTIAVTGTRPAGFPRGELLSVGTNGARNCAVDPVNLLAWVHKRTTKRLTLG